MSNTPKEREPRTEAKRVRWEGLVNVRLPLAEFPSDLLILLAQTLGNPLELLVAKAHLSKAFCEAARAAQGLLTRVDLCKWHMTVDDAVVAAVVPKCSQLTSLNLHGCDGITDEAMKAVTSGCKQLTKLNVRYCYNLTDAAVVAVASGCKQLTTLNLYGCRNITDAAVRAVVSGSACKQLTSLEVQWLRMQWGDSTWLRQASDATRLTLGYRGPDVRHERSLRRERSSLRLVLVCRGGRWRAIKQT